MHEIAAVEERDDFDSGRKDLVVQLFYFFVDSGEGFVGVGAFAKEDDAFDDVVVVKDGAIRFVNSLPYLSEADTRALGYGGDIFHAQHGAIFGGDGGLLDVPDGAEQPYYSHVDLLEAGFDKAAASVGAVDNFAKLLFDPNDAEAK